MVSLDELKNSLVNDPRTYTQVLEDAKNSNKCLLVYLHSDEHDDTVDFVPILKSTEFSSFLTQDILLIHLRKKEQKCKRAKQSIYSKFNSARLVDIVIVILISLKNIVQILLQLSIKRIYCS